MLLALSVRLRKNNDRRWVLPQKGFDYQLRLLRQI
jgi:hypothetical protein